MCAVTVTPVLAGVTTYVADIEATADADVAAVCPHGLPSAPTIVTLVPFGDVAAARLSNWGVTSVDAVNVNLEATAAVGSGAAGTQVRVFASVPHTLIQ